MWYTMSVLCGLLLAVLVGSPRAAVQCDGVDDLLTQALSLDAFVQADTFTVVAWVVGSGSVFGGESCWANGPWLMDANEYVAVGRSGTTAAGDVCVYAFDGASHNLTTPAQAGMFHVAARLSGGTLTLFVAGENLASATMGAISDLSGILQLCGGPDGHSPDQILDVVIYETALSDATIAGMASARQQYAPRGSPTAYWPLDDCGNGASGHGVIFRDRSGNNRHLTGAQGDNGAGLTCHATSTLSRPWGIQ